MKSNLEQWLRRVFLPQSDTTRGSAAIAWVLALALIAESVYSLQNGILIDFCVSGRCSSLLSIHLYPLDRSLFLWGAMYYAVASYLMVNQRTNLLAPLFMLMGVIGHSGLVIYGWQATGKVIFCTACVSLYTSLVGLTILAWLTRPFFAGAARWNWTRRLPLVMVLVTCMAFLINPALTRGEISAWADSWLGSAPDQSAQPLPAAGPSDAPTAIPSPSADPGAISVSPVNPQPNPEQPAVNPPPVVSGPASQSEPPLVKPEPPPANPEPPAIPEDRLLTVLSSGGETATLDLGKKPVLFVSVQCSSCGDMLKAVAQPGARQPAIVIIGLKRANLSKAEAKLSAAGLAGHPYYLMEDNYPVEEVPTIMLWGSDGRSLLASEDAILAYLAGNR